MSTAKSLLWISVIAGHQGDPGSMLSISVHSHNKHILSTSCLCTEIRFILHACVCVVCSVAQLCPTLCDPMDCSLPGFSVHGIFQARISEWVAISSSRGSSWPRDRTHVSCVSCSGRQILYHCVTWEPQSQIIPDGVSGAVFEEDKLLSIPSWVSTEN